MGSFKDELFDRRDEETDKKIAKALGITYAEFQELDLSEIDTSATGGYIVLRFGQSASRKVLQKIDADSMNRVRLHSSAFE